MNTTDPLLTAREGAKELGCSIPTFWRWVASGTVPRPIKLGGLSRWPRSEILGVVEAAKARRYADNAGGAAAGAGASSGWPRPAATDHATAG